MNLEELVSKIPEVQNLQFVCRANKPARNISSVDFCIAIIETDSGPKAAELIGIGVQTFNRGIKRLFPDVKLNGGGETWRKYILHIIGYKECNKCNEILPINLFDNENCNKQCLAAECKACKKIINFKKYNKNPEYWQEYLKLHRGDYNRRNAERRARLRLAIPAWADLDKIKIIYDNRPEGYHIDHYYPLYGEIVCGLHVENNLKCITAEENMAKGNMMPEDFYNLE